MPNSDQVITLVIGSKICFQQGFSQNESPESQATA